MIIYDEFGTNTRLTDFVLSFYLAGQGEYVLSPWMSMQISKLLYFPVGSAEEERSTQSVEYSWLFHYVCTRWWKHNIYALKCEIRSM